MFSSLLLCAVVLYHLHAKDSRRHTDGPSLGALEVLRKLEEVVVIQAICLFTMGYLFDWQDPAFSMTRCC